MNFQLLRENGLVSAHFERQGQPGDRSGYLEMAKDKAVEKQQLDGLATTLNDPRTLLEQRLGMMDQPSLDREAMRTQLSMLLAKVFRQSAKRSDYASSRPQTLPNSTTTPGKAATQEGDQTQEHRHQISLNSPARCEGRSSKYRICVERIC